MFLRDTPGRTAIHNEDFCSVAIVSFNRHHRLRNLIDSIHEHADMPFELVVSDDGGPFYDDFNFMRDLRDKVSHFAINMGMNKGLHVNSNTAVSMTRSKYIFVFNDDTKVTGSFMRRCVNVLEHAPYVGCIELEAGLENLSEPGPGRLDCRTPDGQEYALTCSLGGSWALGFRKSYWQDVGGYSEDDIYGDIPFINKGWTKGYFSCRMVGHGMAIDTDKDENQLSVDSTGKFIKGSYCNYPKIFGIEESDLVSWGNKRHAECSKRSVEGRGNPLSEFSWSDWHPDYMCKAIPGNDQPINWEVLEKYHSRFLEEVKRDLIQ